eukprot:366360-Chlamydomonas_euryale.AAC.14
MPMLRPNLHQIPLAERTHYPNAHTYRPHIARTQAPSPHLHTCSSGGSDACSGSASSGPQDPAGSLATSALIRAMAFSISACPVRKTSTSPGRCGRARTASQAGPHRSEQQGTEDSGAFGNNTLQPRSIRSILIPARQNDNSESDRTTTVRVTGQHGRGERKGKSIATNAMPQRSTDMRRKHGMESGTQRQPAL